MRELNTYFLLAYSFTWTCHLVVLVFRMPFSLDLAEPVTWLYCVGILGPSVSAILLSVRQQGAAGLHRLVSQAVRWRFGMIWYLVALLVAPTVTLIDIGLRASGLSNPSAWFRFPVLLAVGQIWVVLGEEYGWRGFALPRLQRSLGSLGGSLILGVIWAAWHLPMFFVPGSPQYTKSLVADFGSYVLTVMCWSILMAVLYNRTGGSLLPCMLFHASLNISAFSIDVPEGSSSMAYFYLAIAAAAIPLLPRPLLTLKVMQRADSP